MPTLYQRALGLSAVVLVAALVALALSITSTASNQQRLGALTVRESVDGAEWATSELLRTRDLAWADSARLALDRGRQATAELADADAGRVLTALSTYRDGVDRLEAALTARGVNEGSGAEGRFRDRVHAIERHVEGGAPSLLVPILQARRREKDYLLRGDVRYAPMVQDHVADARREVQAHLAPREAEAVLTLLEAYESGFLDLVRHSEAADAEARQIADAADAAQRVVHPVALQAAGRARLLGALSLLAALFSALVVGLAVLYQARGITQPVYRLRDAAARIARGETSTRVAVEGPDEIRTLARALNGVADYAERTAKAERQLAETERFLQTVLDRAQEGVVVLDPDYRITYANPHAETIYGTTLEAVRGHRPDELFAYVEPSGRRSYFDKALAGEVVAADDLETEVGGRAVWLASTYAPLTDEDGVVRGVVATVHDVSHRVETEQALREAKDEAEENRRLIRTVIDAIPDPILVHDRSGRCVLANEAAARDAGHRRPGDLVGQALEAVFPPTVADEVAGGLQTILASGEAIYNQEHPAVDDPDRTYSTTRVPLRNDGGAVVGVVGVSRDVTHEKAAQAALLRGKEAAEEAARLKSAFLANMSHEIRTPLTGILGYADLLAEDAPAEVADLAEVIQRAGHRLLDTLNSVLDLAQLESGTMEVRSEPVDATTLVRETAELFASAADQAGLALEAHLEPNVSVVADGRALGRVVANLVSNAIKFTERGSVALRLVTEHDAARLDVVDTGIGMSRAFMERMFDEFQQESTGHARTHEGNGLGLTIVRRLVDLMGGSLAVRSAPGDGTTFTLRLPLADAPSARTRPVSEAAAL